MQIDRTLPITVFRNRVHNNMSKHAHKDRPRTISLSEIPPSLDSANNFDNYSEATINVIKPNSHRKSRKESYEVK